MYRQSKKDHKKKKASINILPAEETACQTPLIICVYSHNVCVFSVTNSNT